MIPSQVVRIHVGAPLGWRHRLGRGADARSIQAHFQPQEEHDVNKRTDCDHGRGRLQPLHLLPPRHVPAPRGRRTTAHYATREAVEALLSLGDLSALGCSLAECEAYYRDRGEELHKPTHWSDRWVLAREAFDRFWGGVQLPLHGRRVALLRRRWLDARCRLAGVRQN